MRPYGSVEQENEQQLMMMMIDVGAVEVYERNHVCDPLSGKPQVKRRTNSHEQAL
jgi:hypothetical protein